MPILAEYSHTTYQNTNQNSPDIIPQTPYTQQTTPQPYLTETDFAPNIVPRHGTNVSRHGTNVPSRGTFVPSQGTNALAVQHVIHVLPCEMHSTPNSDSTYEWRQLAAQKSIRLRLCGAQPNVTFAVMVKADD